MRTCKLASHAAQPRFIAGRHGHGADWAALPLGALAVVQQRSPHPLAPAQ